MLFSVFSMIPAALSVMVVFAAYRKTENVAFTIAPSEDIRSLYPGTARNFVDNQATSQMRAQ
jgi:hypothetical protein